MKRLRPLTGRYQTFPATARPSLGTRNNFQAVNKNRMNITPEEILELKAKKNQLEQEKHLLQAKSNRLEQYIKFPRKIQSNDQNTNYQRQIRALKSYVINKNAEIKRLSQSDLAASISEIQEEIKILHLELVRLQTEKHDKSCLLGISSMRLNELSERYSDSSICQAQVELDRIEAETHNTRKKNKKLQDRLDKIHDQNLYIQETFGHPALAEEIKQLKALILEKTGKRM